MLLYHTVTQAKIGAQVSVAYYYTVGLENFSGPFMLNQSRLMNHLLLNLCISPLYL